MALKSTYALIETAIKDILQGAGLTINGIVIDRELVWGKTQPPCIYVFFEPSEISGEVVGSCREEWTLSMTVMAVSAGFAEADARESKDLILDATDALVANRSLNNSVSDNRRKVWHPIYTRDLGSTKLFGSAMEMDLLFINKEV